MEQIYNFEQVRPPVLNEKMIRSKIEKQRLNLQTALVAFSEILLFVVTILLGFFAYETYPWIALFCFLYALVSVTGGAVLAVIFTRKGGQLIC